MSQASLEEVLLSRLDEHVDSGPASPEARPGHWRTVPYQAEGIDGVMLACGEATRPEPVCVRLVLRACTGSGWGCTPGEMVPSASA